MIEKKYRRLVPLYLIPCALFGANSIVLSSNEIAENQPLMVTVGILSVEDSPGSQWQYAIDTEESADGESFTIVGNQLRSYASFDYEKKSSYVVEILATNGNAGESISQAVEVEVTDLSGKWDSNGLADSELAAAYPEVNEGDYVIFNGTNGGLSVNFYQEIRYPNKILIKGGEYEDVKLTLSNVMGNSADQRVAITNFLGQVKASKFSCANGKYWRLTGRYDPENQLGSRFYRGCDTNESTVDFGGSRGTYGIWINNKWKSEGVILCYILGNASGFEVDHMEISDGGFAGLMVKRDSGTEDMNDVYIHHMYIHDIGSEGIYLGSTQSDPQHQFVGLLIENNLFVRTGGEAIQTGQLREGSIIRNNVAWGAFDWMSPFARFQDSVIQMVTRQGDVRLEKNIAMGGAGTMIFAGNNGKSTIVPNGEPIVIDQNLFWGSRGYIAGYQANTSDGVTPWLWSENYFGYFNFDYNRVYPANNRNYHLGIATPNSVVTFRENTYAPVKNLYAAQGSGTQYVVENNAAKDPVAPVFMNLIGEDPDYPYLLWKRWSAKVGEESGFDGAGTNKGQLITYAPGEVVQYHHNGETRFYRSLQSNTDHEPPVNGDSVWELLTWTVDGRLSYYPPDDARLEPDSFYGEKGIGLFEEEPIQAEPLIREWGGFPWFDSEGLVDTLSWLGWIHVARAPWIWSYSFESYMYLPEPEADAAGAWIFKPLN